MVSWASDHEKYYRWTINPCTMISRCVVESPQKSGSMIIIIIIIIIISCLFVCLFRLMALVPHLSSPVSHNSNVNVLLSVDTIHICLVWCSYVSVACCLWSRWLRLPSQGYALIKVWPPTPESRGATASAIYFFIFWFSSKNFFHCWKKPSEKN